MTCSALLLSSVTHSIDYTDNGLHECWHNAAMAALAFCPAIWQYFKQSEAPAKGSILYHLQKWLRGFDGAMAVATGVKEKRKDAKAKFNAVRGRCIFLAPAVNLVRACLSVCLSACRNLQMPFARCARSPSRSRSVLASTTT